MAIKKYTLNGDTPLLFGKKTHKEGDTVEMDEDAAQDLVDSGRLSPAKAVTQTKADAEAQAKADAEAQAKADAEAQAKAPATGKAKAKLGGQKP